VVPPLVRQFAPDVLVAQLGVDTHYRDPLTRLMLTTRGYGAVVEELKALAESAGRWLAFGGGGVRRRRGAAGLDPGLRRDVGAELPR